ncbi:hypothetical protein TMatcc_000351 [Talaromyces marneffei ATCC 18224]|uniref:HIT domain protein n=1 Tax=Talaromyces marneffei (strain ATCC 18224 / CBS 334.59 / QM 7333) TaxID=441960 RepID=B6QQR0_TALMQ|nr:uncharacterized protein EYB26_005431 [Talaromyces marneffei]EEA20365.1 HIT domain protein [Talaromyces marneffei ATCC 18224]KAE8549357.1 hypothetical protein EYB25_007878 [Talaromyces marneffei]QGA17755.1 hypothetical protein EYB26_005431 [Talaromyces marneffei]
MPNKISPTCPFCAIATAHPPLPPSSALQTIPQQHDNSYPGSSSRSHAFLVLSTKYVLAFLDIMPLSKGHILVTTREHYEKVGELGVRIGEELGRWLPIVSRVGMRVIFGQSSAVEEHHWNLVQNNGERAAQVVPHVHFHIIPRPPLVSADAMAQSPGWTMFGRGRREDLDDDEGEELAKLLREELAREVKRVKQEEGIDLDVERDYRL